MNRTELTPRFDRTRPEPPHVQAAIQRAAELKRARKAAKRQRDAELTFLGREVSRAQSAATSLFEPRIPFSEALCEALDRLADAEFALDVRRAVDPSNPPTETVPAEQVFAELGL